MDASRSCLRLSPAIGGRQFLSTVPPFSERCGSMFELGGVVGGERGEIQKEGM